MRWRFEGRVRPGVMAAAIIGLCVLLAAAVVCAVVRSGPEGPTLLAPAVVTGDSPVAEHVGAWLDKSVFTVEELTDQEFIYIYLKNTGENSRSHLPRARLKLLRDGVWYDLVNKLPEGRVIVDSDQWIGPGETGSAVICLSMYGRTLTPGRYRGVVHLGDHSFACVEFDVID